MATKRITTDGAVTLELAATEYDAVKRALAKALIRARQVGASADEADLVRLMSALGPEVFSFSE